MRIQTLRTRDDKMVPLGQLTILVGPNNVGKSQTLRDIHTRIVSGKDARTTLIKDAKIVKPASFDDVLSGLEVVDDPNNVNQHIVRGVVSNLLGGDQVSVHLPGLRSQFQSSPDLSFLPGNIGRFRVAYLDASSRLQVAQSGPSSNPYTQSPGTLLQALYADGARESELRETFKKTFGMDIRLDYSGLQQLYLRIAKEFEPVPEDPRKAYPILSKHHPLDTQGDGFRSFVGVVLSLLLCEGRLILLDEPEAFLHPAQARQLGHWVASHSAKLGSQIIIATHNANFLSGILGGATDVTILRLNRVANDTSYNVIPSLAVVQLARSPVLSSQRVLESIFHKGVVICEADADRSVYQLVSTKEFGNQNLLFVHAHNKQTIKDVASLLRAATIPCCAICDIDILNSKDDLANLVRALSESSDLTAIEAVRQPIRKSRKGGKRV